MGAVVNHSGACATLAYATMRAIGFQPFAFAFSSDVTTRAAAPSLIFEEFAAVTVPSFWNAGFNVGIFSSGAANGSSSASISSGSPFFCGDLDRRDLVGEEARLRRVLRAPVRLEARRRPAPRA